MSSRSKRRQAILKEARSEYLREKEAFYRATNPEAYFKAKIKVVDNLSRNGITPADLEKKYQRGYDEGCGVVSRNLGTMYTSAMMLALNDLHGFAGKRLCTLMDKMNEYMTTFLSSADAVLAVYDRFGLKFDESDPFHPLQPKDRGGDNESWRTCSKHPSGCYSG